MSNPQLAAAYMQAVAASARVTAIDLETEKLWPGEFSQAVALIQENLKKAQGAMGEDR